MVCYLYKHIFLLYLYFEKHKQFKYDKTFIEHILDFKTKKQIKLCISLLLAII